MSKTIVVTGVSGPMGRVVAKKLTEEGYYVIGLTSKADAVNGEIAELLVCDFKNRSAISDAVDQISSSHPRIDGIVNLAGVFIEMEEFKRDALKNFEETFDVNFWPALILTSGLSESLDVGSVIVNISSTDANFGGISGAGYAASKAALNSLSMSLANILAYKRVRSNTIAIGWAGAGMGTPKEVLDMIAKDNLTGRVADYTEVAELVSFLMSNKSTYINGATINFDGGDSSSNAFLAEEARILSSSKKA